MQMIRENRMGVRYQLLGNNQETHITSIPKGKLLVVQQPIERLNQAWYNWQMKGQKIQEAFSFLSDGEREFLMTGILPDEWDALFSEEEK